MYTASWWISSVRGGHSVAIARAWVMRSADRNPR